MRIARPFFILALLLNASHPSLAGQATKYGVTVQASKPAELAKAKTYVWTADRPSFAKDVNAWIVAAVDRELGARGFTKLESGQSDVVVGYSSLSRTDVDLKNAPKGTAVAPEFTVGTLVVNMSSPTDKESLFRVRVDQPIEGDLTTLEAVINAAVKAMFEKYPARPPS